MDGASIVGQTLDGKYQIESEIGKGGMGTVYLATHVGTERPVALKVIASEFMQRGEFVERFRREARAAGRLRHPNVVNVTDFGFARTKTGEAAYLVMEYLDGCTLGEILEEEKKLPLAWTLDILEQVSSAVQEAHEQGIIHRDLKPDNIWLEPNQRGGYTVKVLDFGIAKLEESIGDAVSAENLPIPAANFQAARATVADLVSPHTVAERHGQTIASEKGTIAQFAANDSEAGTMIQSAPISSESGTLIQSNGVDSESGTLIQPNGVDSESGTLIQPSGIDLKSGTLIQPNELDSESGTAIFPVQPILSLAQKSENIGTRLITEKIETNDQPPARATAELTRVGAVLGTPLYMSPEQCRGERLTAQSDIYSLGVIAYQMLSGKTPFAGDYLDVMEAHKTDAPPPLENKKVRKKVKRVINAALSKDLADRPPTAQAFAAELRAESEGIRELFRRALVIYSQHLGKFVGLSALLYSPLAILTVLQLTLSILALNDVVSESTKDGLNIFLSTVAGFFIPLFCGYLVSGTTTWLVVQILAVPLRPVRVRPALRAAMRKWKTFAGTGMLSGTLIFVGYVLCLVPGVVLSVLWALVAPLVMMENLRGFAALRRSKMLVKRSLRTTAFAIFIMFFVPFMISATTAFVANAVAKSIGSDAQNVAEISRRVREEIDKENGRQTETAAPPARDENLQIKINGSRVGVSDKEKPRDMIARIRETVRETLSQILLFPLSVLVGSFSSIVVALLYLKTRQVGGEPMQELLARFEDADQPRTNWQRRVRERLEQSGKVTSRI